MVVANLLSSARQLATRGRVSEEKLERADSRDRAVNSPSLPRSVSRALRPAFSRV